jgi:hypothetical protein
MEAPMSSEVLEIRSERFVAEVLGSGVLAQDIGRQFGLV